MREDREKLDSKMKKAAEREERMKAKESAEETSEKAKLEV